MIALKVRINEAAPVLAGREDLGVLTAVLNCVGPLGALAQPVEGHEEPELFFHLGGMTSRAGQEDHLLWINHQALGLGDRVEIEVVDADRADPTLSSEAAREHERDERDYFEHCKRVYLELRAKYERQ